MVSIHNYAPDREETHNCLAVPHVRFGWFYGKGKKDYHLEGLLL